MNIKNLLVISIYVSLFFTGCSFKTSEEVVDMSSYLKNKNSIHSNASLQESNYQNYIKSKQLSKKHSKNNPFNEFTNNNYITKKSALNNELFDFYSKWEGVRYKLGGESKKGIDCSAFIQKAFKEKFDLEMPRTTLLQAKVGKEIKKNELEIGDLVFFKTGKSKHVGIYIDNGKFMHASTKIGVTISDLDNDYFSKNYWKAQRIID
ncbi:MAG: NlpC/P60 family protein [Arcobacter sp.]|jgi:lipoprotein Spr|uniref:NlpC/P60 family protein n=1 Tax=unclassified Arcobacter TaxID=2593671 RepID=UPI0002296638|nr:MULTISPECIES: NlpC/P60 family protein [unclassified Arcobacter]MDY3199475.1 NlpC/P60 family protein [Arcobacter sp.]BAK74469.1 lipoprotein [Arcobacter sp. L]